MTEVSASQTNDNKRRAGVVAPYGSLICRGGYQPPAITHAPVGAGLPDSPPPKTTVPTDTAGVRGRLIAAPTARNDKPFVGHVPARGTPHP